jgi:hypothetical protein
MYGRIKGGTRILGGTISRGRNFVCKSAAVDSCGST